MLAAYQYNLIQITAVYQQYKLPRYHGMVSSGLSNFPGQQLPEIETILEDSVVCGRHHGQLYMLRDACFASPMHITCCYVSSGETTLLHEQPCYLYAINVTRQVYPVIELILRLYECTLASVS